MGAPALTPIWRTPAPAPAFTPYTAAPAKSPPPPLPLPSLGHSLSFADAGDLPGNFLRALVSVSRAISCQTLARAGLALIILVPLVLIPVHGFMDAHGLDDLLLGAYSLLLTAAICCVPLTAPEAIAAPAQVLSLRLRLGYASAWMVVPLLLRDLDWTAYATLPLGTLGLLAVRNIRSAWFCDVYVLGLLAAPCAAISLAYALELSGANLVTGLSVTQWQQRAPSADAFAFSDGYVVR